MAYKTELQTTCATEGCSRPATWRVCNHRNAEIGKYCKRHADEQIARLHRDEGRAHREDP